VTATAAELSLGPMRGCPDRMEADCRLVSSVTQRVDFKVYRKSLLAIVRSPSNSDMSTKW